MFIEPGTSKHYRASLFNSIVVPRPIGWISSVSAAGVPNLAPFSYFNGVSAAPPMVMFACNAAHASGGEKDTLANVRATKQFAVNLVTRELAERMNLSSVAAPREVDEFDHAGLSRAECRIVRCPRVAESPVAMECELVQIVELPTDEASGQRNNLVVGRVLGLHIDDALFDADGRIDLQPLGPVARLGGFRYGVIGGTFEMRRPHWSGDPPASPATDGASA